MSTTISERIARVPRWRHQIQLPGGVVTPGTQKTLAQLPTIGLAADLSGKTVIDMRDPTSCWVPSEACTVSMLQSCGFCDVSTFSSIHGRGVFHGFTPARGDDIDRLLRIVDAGMVARTATAVLRREIDRTGVPAALRSVGVQEFGRIRQEAAELQAKEWSNRTPGVR